MRDQRVRCNQCSGSLGHVVTHEPTGEPYCISSHDALSAAK